MRTVTNILLLLVLAVAAVRLLERLSPLNRAWTPSDLSRLDGPATALRIASAGDDPRWCRQILRASGVTLEPVPDRVTGPGCGFTGAVRLTGAPWSPRGTVVTCPVAVAMDSWEKLSVRPAARALVGSNLTGIDHYGSYSCRPIAGSSRQSQHATANAVDIAGFRFARGAPASVTRDWNGSGPRRDFLRRVHDDACKLFGTTLGPDYNAAHRDHFHLDMANWNFCR